MIDRIEILVSIYFPVIDPGWMLDWKSLIGGPSLFNEQLTMFWVNSGMCRRQNLSCLGAIV